MKQIFTLFSVFLIMTSDAYSIAGFGLNFNQPLIDHFDTHISKAKSKSLKW